MLTSIFSGDEQPCVLGGTTRAQWEDVTGSTPLTFVNDSVSFTTTVSARFWLVDCRHSSHDVIRMATDLYKEAIHVPFMAKYVSFHSYTLPVVWLIVSEKNLSHFSVQ